MEFPVEKTLTCGHRITFTGGPLGKVPAPPELPHQKDERVIEGYGGLLADYPELSPSRVLEIGVCGGGSLAIWRAMWPEADVIGVDNNLGQVPQWTRDHLESGGCGKPAVLRHIDMPPAVTNPADLARRELQGLGEFDLIVDDGGHGPRAVFPGFEIMWPMLRPGGLYIVEDWIQDFLEPQKTSWFWLQRLIGDWQADRGVEGSPYKVAFYRGLVAMQKR